MNSVIDDYNSSEYDFISNTINILKTRYDDEDTRLISTTISYWWDLLKIFNNKILELKKSLKLDKKELEEFEHSYGIIQLYALETIKQAEFSAVSMVAGFYESSFILLRSAIEKMVNALYFTIDPQALDGWLSGKRRISVTGKNGMINRLCSENFILEKTGLPLPSLLDEFSEYLKSAYNRYSKVVHGVVMGATSLLEPYIASKGEPEKFVKLITEVEKDYINNFKEIIRGTLDLLGSIYIMSLVISTKGAILKENYGNEVLQGILPHFFRTDDFVKKLYGLEE